MYIRKIDNDIPMENKRLLSSSEGQAYTSLGKTKFRSWCEEIGAVRKIGRSVRFDRAEIDKHLDSLG